MLRELSWQFLATINLVLGGWYIGWRWGWSLNYEALWFALPLAMAETASYFGVLLFTLNLWALRDYRLQPPPALITDCVRVTDQIPTRCIGVDVYFPAYKERRLRTRASEHPRCQENQLSLSHRYPDLCSR
jgi:cellulose synthase (UDP-forming)